MICGAQGSIFFLIATEIWMLAGTWSRGRSRHAMCRDLLCD